MKSNWIAFSLISWGSWQMAQLNCHLHCLYSALYKVLADGTDNQKNNYNFTGQLWHTNKWVQNVYHRFALKIRSRFFTTTEQKK